MQKNSLNKIAGNIHFEKQIFFFLKNGSSLLYSPPKEFWVEVSRKLAEVVII